MFTLAELDDDASLLLDLKEDVRDECSSLGEVTNVVLYDVRTPFAIHSSGSCYTERARGRDDRQVSRSSKCTCVCYRKFALLFKCQKSNLRPQKMNGRFFSGRKIEATLYAGKQRFQRSGAGDAVEGNSDEAEKKRLDDFAQWLLTEGD